MDNYFCSNCGYDHPYPSNRWLTVNETPVCKLKLMIPKSKAKLKCHKCLQVGSYRAHLSGAKLWMVCAYCDKYISLLREYKSIDHAIASITAITQVPIVTKSGKPALTKAAIARFMDMDKAKTIGKFEADLKPSRPKRAYTGDNLKLVSDSCFELAKLSRLVQTD